MKKRILIPILIILFVSSCKKMYKCKCIMLETKETNIYEIRGDYIFVKDSCINKQFYDQYNGNVKYACEII